MSLSCAHRDGRQWTRERGSYGEEPYEAGARECEFECVRERAWERAYEFFGECANLFGLQVRASYACEPAHQTQPADCAHQPGPWTMESKPLGTIRDQQLISV